MTRITWTALASQCVKLHKQQVRKISLAGFTLGAVQGELAAGWERVMTELGENMGME